MIYQYWKWDTLSPSTVRDAHIHTSHPQLSDQQMMWLHTICQEKYQTSVYIAYERWASRVLPYTITLYAVC